MISPLEKKKKQKRKEKNSNDIYSAEPKETCTSASSLNREGGREGGVLKEKVVKTKNWLVLSALLLALAFILFYFAEKSILVWWRERGGMKKKKLT